MDIRVIAAAEEAEQAVRRLPELFELTRQAGPYPSRKDPQAVRYYLTVRLREAQVAPLAEIEDLKASRNLVGELGAIKGHWANMEAQPWWPVEVGDIAIGHQDEPDGYGATFLAVRWPGLGGEVRFKTISSTVRDDPTPRGGYGIEDLWFEWPAISIVRAGAIYPPRRAAIPTR